MTQYYLHADLVTGDDRFVVRIGLPPFKAMPEAIQWGARHFVLRNSPQGPTSAGQVWRYYEVYCYAALPGSDTEVGEATSLATE